MLSGCGILLLPLQLVYFIVSGTVGLAVGLAPVAAKLLPLLLFVVQVQPENPADKFIVKPFPFNFGELEMRLVREEYENGMDPIRLLSDSIKNNKMDSNSYIFIFDAEIPHDIIKARITRELGDKYPSKIECYYVDGSVLFNDKYQFFVFMDKFREKGVCLKSFGSLGHCNDLYYNEPASDTDLL